jgi:glutathione S-transferase
MPKLFSSPASPYSAKVRMAAVHAGFALDVVPVIATEDPAALHHANPLGKVPTLVLDDGAAIYDSRVITQFINSHGNGALFPKNALKRLATLQREALADGICDCLIAYMYEIRLRPEDKRMASIMDRQLAKAMRGLDALCAGKLPVPARIDCGHIAVRAMIGYLDLRFAGKWEKGRGKLKRFAAAFDAKFPELARQLPHA